MLLTVVATTVKATVVNSPERTHEPPFQDQRAAAVVCTQIIRQPPTEESEALVGRRIMRKWEGFAFGWCAGVITSVDSDGRRTIDKANGQLLRALRHGPGGGGARSSRARARSIRDDRPRTPSTTRGCSWRRWSRRERREERRGRRSKTKRRPGRRRCSFPR